MPPSLAAGTRLKLRPTPRLFAQARLRQVRTSPVGIAIGKNNPQITGRHGDNYGERLESNGAAMKVVSGEAAKLVNTIAV
jgi:hypothetical protein